MQPFLDEQGFKAQENGNFKNDKREIKIAYDEDRQMYVLSAADIGEEGDGELKEIDAWLFDDSQNAKDAASVGVDFTATLRKNMGIQTAAMWNYPPFQRAAALPLRALPKRCSISSPRLKTSTKIT